MIPIDQMIEMTRNKSSEVVGVLSGVTENKSANERMMQISHFLAALKQYLDLRIQRGQLSQHTEFSSIRMKKDKDYLKRVVAGLKLWLPDKWKKERPLDLASDEMVRNILSARKTGEDAMTKFYTRFTDFTIPKKQSTMTQ